jgi:hypothetical protein
MRVLVLCHIEQLSTVMSAPTAMKCIHTSRNSFRDHVSIVKFDATIAKYPTPNYTTAENACCAKTRKMVAENLVEKSKT